MSKSLKKLIDINRLREFKNKLVGTDSVYVQTAAVDQTIAGTKTFSKPIVGSVTGSSGSCTGNAATATNATYTNWLRTSSHSDHLFHTEWNRGYFWTYVTTGDGDYRAVRVARSDSATTAEACTGNAATATKLATTRAINGTNFDGSAAITTANWGTARNIYVADSDGTNTGAAVSVNGSANATLKLPATIKASITGNCSGSSGSCTGNATSATKLQTARTINGTSFDGSANITTANWGTARDITIADSTGDNTSEAVSVNGSAAVTLKLPATIKASLDGNAATATSATTAASATTATNATNAAKLGNIASSGYVQTGKVNQTIDGTKTFSAAIVGSVTGNAGSATKLATARTINGTSFNGTANITTANWGTARDISITDGTNTSTAVSVNGSANVSLKLPATIKAAFVGNITGNVTGNVTGNCSGSSGSCTGNAATATKLAAKRTIALSGAATGTATAFDGSGNITIPVTALAASAIRAQWYAAYPDGPEAHNAMWGGRDITAAFDAGTVSEHIADGTFRDIFPGDYITKSVTISGKTYTVSWVVADCDYWIDKGAPGSPLITHHVAIVPEAPIFEANMNATNTTEGGYKGSRMYRETIPACATGIVNAFGSEHILTFWDGITNSVDTSHVSSGIPQWTGTPGWWDADSWVSVQCNLMSEKMVYGAPICAAGAMDSTMATRQMSAFRLSEWLINNHITHNRRVWWLRDVASSAYFACVGGFGGFAGVNVASSSLGVRPFALLV